MWIGLLKKIQFQNQNEPPLKEVAESTDEAREYAAATEAYESDED